MYDYWHRHVNQYGNWAEPEIYELARANHYDLANEMGFSLDDDPEIWNEDDWLDFERNREEFERQLERQWREANAASIQAAA